MWALGPRKNPSYLIICIWNMFLLPGLEREFFPSLRAYMGRGERALNIFLSPRSYMGKGTTTMSLRVESRLPQTLAVPRPTAVSFRESLELILRRPKSDPSHLASLGASPTGCSRGRGKLKIFLNSSAYIVLGRGIFSNPRAYIEAELEIFPSPRAQVEASLGVEFLQIPRSI